ncbi:MAG: glycosyltransferase [Candidatus Eisenbacteria bacterium]
MQRETRRHDKVRVLFFHNIRVSWTRRDLHVLSQHFDTREIYFRRRLSDLFRLARYGREADVFFCWLGNTSTFVATLFARAYRKRCIVIAGGDDVVNLPEIKYGAMRPGVRNVLRRTLCRLALRSADRVLAVSRATRKDAIENAGVSAGKIFVMYHGFDVNGPVDFSEKARSLVITVGEVKRDNLERKGLRIFVESARHVPEATFVVVGRWVDKSVERLMRIASPNVFFTGYVPDSELRAYLERAKVYVQISAHEGFGCSLAEAMSCGCVPVVTGRFAIPELVGDCGVYVPAADARLAADGIRRALRLDNSCGERCRERVRTSFPLERREADVLRHVIEVASAQT